MHGAAVASRAGGQRITGNLFQPAYCLMRAACNERTYSSISPRTAE